MLIFFLHRPVSPMIPGAPSTPFTPHLVACRCIGFVKQMCAFLFLSLSVSWFSVTLFIQEDYSHLSEDNGAWCNGDAPWLTGSLWSKHTHKPCILGTSLHGF